MVVIMAGMFDMAAAPSLAALQCKASARRFGETILLSPHPVRPEPVEGPPFLLGAAPGGETHYSVEIVSEAFAGLSRVQVQRAVMMVLQKEFDTGLHALALKAAAPAAS